MKIRLGNPDDLSELVALQVERFAFLRGRESNVRRSLLRAMNDRRSRVLVLSAGGRIIASGQMRARIAGPVEIQSFCATEKIERDAQMAVYRGVRDLALNVCLQANELCKEFRSTAIFFTTESSSLAKVVTGFCARKQIPFECAITDGRHHWLRNTQSTETSLPVGRQYALFKLRKVLLGEMIIENGKLTRIGFWSK